MRAWERLCGGGRLETDLKLNNQCGGGKGERKCKSGLYNVYKKREKVEELREIRTESYP